MNRGNALLSRKARQILSGFFSFFIKNLAVEIIGMMLCLKNVDKKMILFCHKIKIHSYTMM